MEIAILLGVLILTLLAVDTWRLGISPMPSSLKAKKALLALIPKDLKGHIYELGAGWGTLAFPLAERFPQNPIIAYEKALIPYLFCRLRLWLHPLPNLHIKCKDFYQEDLADAGLIVCYLYPGAMSKLAPKLQKKLLSGACIISNTFALPNWKAEKVVELDDLYRTKIYLYQTTKRTKKT